MQPELREHLKLFLKMCLDDATNFRQSMYKNAMFECSAVLPQQKASESYAWWQNYSTENPQIIIKDRKTKANSLSVSQA